MSIPAHASELEWKPEWRAVGLLEGLSLVPLGGAILAVNFAWKPPEEPRWRGGVLFDSDVRRVMRGRTRSAQRAAQDIGDILYLGGTIAPILIDSAVVALGIHRAPDVALQLLLIDLQSLALSGLLALTAEHGAGRARPYVGDCEEPDGYALDAEGQPLINRCGGTRSVMSFYSGHAAATATVAGLTCIHHQHVPLYGGGLSDLVPCLAMIGVSLGTGLTRMISDVHWASDVVLGWGLGAVAGYVLPAVLHYGFSDASVVPVAWIDARGASLMLVGAY